VNRPRRLPLLALAAGLVALAAQPVAADPGRPAGGPARDLSTACPAGEVSPTRFTDTAGSAHAAAIACLRWYAIGRGTSDATFGELSGVTRAQAASFLVRLLDQAGVELPSDAPDAFTDDDGSPHQSAIDALAQLGVVTGKEGRYEPDRVVGREQMASLLVRAAELVREADLADDGDHFSDDDRSVHAEAIDKLAGAGIVAGRGPGVFDPAGPVTRGQMASFLMRLVDLLVEEGEVRKPASLDWPEGEWLPGDVLSVAVRGEGVTSVTVTGCGLAEAAVADLDAAVPGIQFTVTVPEVMHVDEDGEVEDECEIEVWVAFDDGRTQLLEGEIELAEVDEEVEDDRDEHEDDEQDEGEDAAA
jgi:hypothetical protein